VVSSIIFHYTVKGITTNLGGEESWIALDRLCAVDFVKAQYYTAQPRIVLFEHESPGDGKTCSYWARAILWDRDTGSHRIPRERGKSKEIIAGERAVRAG